MDPFLFFGIGFIIIIIIQSSLALSRYCFEKKITKKICRRGFKLSQFNDIELLYNSYKRIENERLVISKLEIQTKETSASFIKDSFSIISSIFTGAVLFFSALLITTSTEMLNFISGNEELKKDKSSWIQSMNELSKIIADGIQTSTLIIFSLVFIAYIVVLSLQNSYVKMRIIKKHLSLIEQVEKERGNFS